MSETPRCSSPDTPLDSTIAVEKKQTPLIITHHSPEPWRLFPADQAEFPGHCFEIHDANGLIVLFVAYDEELGITQLELADAALVLAAPQLLQKLQELYQAFLFFASVSETQFNDHEDVRDLKISILKKLLTLAAIFSDLRKAGVLD